MERIALIMVLSWVFMMVDKSIATDGKSEPTHKNIPYSIHERNVLDFWQANKERMDALGVEADLKYPGANTTYRSIPHFFIEKLNGS